ncbi:hypothetical protein ACTS9E_15230 [Empedobacter brevis]
MDIQLVAAELKRHFVQNKKVVAADFARATEVRIDKYCRKITKIKGTYQTLHSLITNVVQGFSPEWTELGEFIVRDMEHKSYRQKINFPFVPAQVLSTALADLYKEGEKPTNQEIAKYITDWIFIQATDDVDVLSQSGERDNAKAVGQFGYSLDGWNTIIKKILVNQEHPCWKVPSDVITDDNVIDVIENFERKFPKLLKKKIKTIHMSTNNLERFSIKYKAVYRDSPNYNEVDTARSPLGKRTLVGHDDIDDNIVWATLEDNMLNLVDLIENPATFTDVQVQDYKVKLFGEFEKGYSILINQAVCVMDFTGTTLGLGDAKYTLKKGGEISQMKLYYPRETVTPVIP